MENNDTPMGLGAKIGMGIGAAIGLVLGFITGSTFWAAILLIVFMFIGGMGGFFIDEAIANAEDRSFNIKAVAWVVAIILIIVFCVFALKGCSSGSRSNDVKDAFNKDPNSWTQKDKDTVNDFFEWQKKQK